MNRPIKFRAWDKGTKVMFEVGNNTFPLHDIISEGWPLMQFTGLTDKNGKEIYEGDIVKTDDKYYPINPVIYYSDIINEHDGDWDEWYCGFCLDDVDHKPLSTNCEVIGNIYENPKLL